MPSFIDLTGKQFTHYKVIRRDQDRGRRKRTSWICLCELCGKENSVYADNLVSGKCTRCVDCRTRINYDEFREYRLYVNAKSRAKRNSIPFSILLSDVVIPDRCPVLGCEFGRGDGGWCSTSPTLDRVIPGLGYVSGNVAVISWRANRIKSDANIEELEKIVQYVKRESKIARL